MEAKTLFVIGGMVVCDSSEQARKLFEIFINKYNPTQKVFEAVSPYIPSFEPVMEYQNYIQNITEVH